MCRDQEVQYCECSKPLSHFNGQDFCYNSNNYIFQDKRCAINVSTSFLIYAQHDLSKVKVGNNVKFQNER